MSGNASTSIDSTTLAIAIVVAIAVSAAFEGLARVALGSGLPGWLATLIFFAALVGFYVVRE